jgi:hypothetical protein
MQTINDPTGRTDWHDDFLNKIPLNQTSYKVNIDDPMGYQIRIHPSGMSVYMGHRNPGVYVNDHDRPVPESMAAQAGFDIERWAKAKAKKDAIARATELAEAEFEYQDGDTVIWVSGDYRVIMLGDGFYNVEFVDTDLPEGEPGRFTLLNRKGPLNRQGARALFRDLSGTDPEAEVSAEAESPSAGVEADVDTPRKRKA